MGRWQQWTETDLDIAVRGLRGNCINLYTVVMGLSFPHTITASTAVLLDEDKKLMSHAHFHSLHQKNLMFFI